MFYAMADVAFVGGSLVNKGGQNPIEPAAYSKPVFFGPYMDNFLTEANVLESMGGGFRLRTPHDLIEKMEPVLADHAFRAEAGRKALEAVESQKGALLRTINIVKGVVGGSR
jgi:3-deoxy-D-manno-octulosonic-acid transferase